MKMMIGYVMGVFLFMFAISDYLALRVEVLVSGVALLAVAVYFLGVAGRVPIASVLFVITIILMILKRKETLLTALALIGISIYYILVLKQPRISGLLWFYTGMAVGLIDNYYLQYTASGDIVITAILFIALGPLALPVYVAQNAYGKLLLERFDYESMQHVYPMGTAVFVGYLALAWSLKYLYLLAPWIIP